MSGRGGGAVLCVSIVVYVFIAFDVVLRRLESLAFGLLPAPLQGARHNVWQEIVARSPLGSFAVIGVLVLVVMFVVAARLKWRYEGIALVAYVVVNALWMWMAYRVSIGAVAMIECIK